MGTGNGGRSAVGDARYRAPEGWGNDGFWRDSSIDADYKTTTHRAIRPGGDGSHGDPGGYGNPGSAARRWSRRLRRPGGAWRAGWARAGRGRVVPLDPVVTALACRVVLACPVVPEARAGLVVPVGPRRPGGHAGPGRNGKPKGDWWRRWTWQKALAVSGVGLALVFVLGVFGVYEYLSSSTTIPAALASANYQNTTVYYADGKKVIGTIGETNRQDLTYPQIPMQLQDAVVAAEDKNFWTEGGISPTGILRAAIHNLTSSGGANGGSTITQEFVRGYYDGVGTQQTASRKVKEIFIAKKLAASKSKQWIMTNYLNLIYLGKNSYGVAAAAQTYFGKPVSQLTVAQDAVLAGIIQQPSTYPLLSFRPQLEARWTYVLQQMVADKYITQAQMDSMKFPKLLTDSGTSASKGASVMAASADPWSPYILNVVYNELTSSKSAGGSGIPVSQVETGGLKIVTTISYSMEKEMYKAVDANIAAIKATPGAVFPSYIRIGAELQNPNNGEILAMYPGPGQNMSATECKKWDCSDNTAVYAREQVGSSFKPYVLSAAVAARHERQDQHAEREPVPLRAAGRPVGHAVQDNEVLLGQPERVRGQRPQQLLPRRERRRRDHRQPEEGRRHHGAERPRPVVQHRVHRPHPPGHHVERDPDGEGDGRQHRGLPDRVGPGPRCRQDSCGRARRRLADGQRAGHDALRHHRQRRLPPGAHRQVLAAAERPGADADGRVAHGARPVQPGEQRGA